jgi:hypothetical protein
MKVESPTTRPDRRSLGMTAITLGTAVLTLLLLSAMPVYTMSRTPPALRFFDPRRSPTRDEGWLVSMMDYALSSSEKNDIVFLGDSSCRAAIDPARFESLTRLRAYNLGIVGDLGPDVRLDLAQAYLSEHPLPRLMVLCVSPVGMERDVPVHWRMLRDRCLDCYGFEPLGLPGRIGYLIRQGTLMSLDKVSPSPVRDDPDIRDSRFAGREDEARETYRMYDSATRSARGFMPLWGYKHATPLQRKHETVLVDPAWYEGLRRLAATCEKVRLPLMIRLTPIPAEGSQILNFEQVAQWLKDVRSACPNAIIGSDPEIVRYPRELMWDGTHINTDGAAKFTATLASQVHAAIDPDDRPKKK